LDLVSIGIDLLELFWELGQTLEEFFDDNYAKHETLTIASESLNDKFKGDTLKHTIEKTVLDDGTEELGDFSQVDMRVLVQESIFIE
jgi:hypothetical protein